MRSLARLLPPHRVALGAAAWLALAGALAAVALAEVAGRAIGEALTGTVRGELLVATSVLALARVGLGLAQGIVSFRLAHRLATQLRGLLLRRALALDPARSPPPTELTTRATHDVTNLQALVAFRAPVAFADTLTVVVLAAYAAHVDAPSVGLALVPLLLAAPLVVLVARRSSVALAGGRSEYAVVIERIAEALAAGLVLRQHGASESTSVAVDDELRRFEATMLRARLLAALGSPLVHVAALSTFVVVVLVVAERIAAGALDRERALAIVAALSLAARPLSRLATSATETSGILASGRRVADLLEAAPLTAPRALRASRGTGTGTGPRRVEVRGLTVRRGERLVLDDIGFEIAAGERLGITGPNGAGKTTLLLALLGLVEHEGQLELDGAAGALGDLCAWVPQEPVLLGGTILSNVALGEEPDPERARRALGRVGALEWLEARGGADATIASAGRDLSVGERQRLCLARALYRERPILVVDEPTAALDPASARAFLDVLFGALDGTTALMVSHDERLLARCDRVLRLEGGRVVPAARADEAASLGVGDDVQPHA